MEKDFLLNSEFARELYESCAKLPIIDYHNHLVPEEAAADRRFENLYELWIAPDPYKHRAMRMCGVPERCITGDASEEEKFSAWCGSFPRLAGSPLYSWSLMELQDILEIQEIPGPETCKTIWRKAEGYLSRNRVSPGSILERYRVEYFSPCMELTKDPEVCQGNTRMKPSLRGDSILFPDKEFIRKLEETTGRKIQSREDYFRAVEDRLDVFCAVGSRFADHSLDDGFRYRRETTDGSGRESGEAEEGKEEDRKEEDRKEEDRKEEDRKEEDRERRERFASEALRYLGGEYARRGMILQLHLGARRYTSTRLRSCAGAAGGYAAIGNSVDLASLTRFLDDVERSGAGLPRVILFALNPSDHPMLSALAGSYSRDGVWGLVTQGPAWWWCDHSRGIRSVLDSTAAYGLLSNFPGMTTDSRSFLSFVRHDYFRRILCSWMAERADSGELPGNPDLLKKLLYNMCYENARRLAEEV